jgi:hypothetical protein
MATVHPLTRPRARPDDRLLPDAVLPLRVRSGRDPSEDHRATTPKARASCDAVGTTPRLAGSPSTPTTIGRPQLRSAYHLDRCDEPVEVDVQDPARTSAGGDHAAQHDPTG